MTRVDGAGRCRIFLRSGKVVHVRLGFDAVAELLEVGFDSAADLVRVPTSEGPVFVALQAIESVES